MSERRTWIVDGLLAALFLVAVELEIWLVSAAGTEVRTRASVLAFAVALPVAFRSRAPVVAFFANGLAVVGMIAAGYPSDVYPWSNLVLVYTLAAAARDVVALAGLAASVLSIFYYFTLFEDELTFIPASLTALVWVLAWAAGRTANARRREAVLAAERDVSRELAAARQARLDLEEHRRVMARELHDLIGHTVNVMVVHAGAGRLALANDPVAARRAFETIEETGRAALHELDGVLGILRSGEGVPTTPMPGVDDLGRLVERFERAGLQVALEVRLPDPIPRGIGATLYRIVQEALTNTLEHSGARSVDVRVHESEGGVGVSVVDDGEGADSPPGRGLTGMAERVALHGGVLSHGPVPGGGYAVEATIPTGILE